MVGIKGNGGKPGSERRRRRKLTGDDKRVASREKNLGAAFC